MTVVVLGYSVAEKAARLPAHGWLLHENHVVGVTPVALVPGGKLVAGAN